MLRVVLNGNASIINTFFSALNYVVSLKMAIGSNKATRKKRKEKEKKKRSGKKIMIPEKLVSKQFINLNWDNVPPVESWQSI